VTISLASEQALERPRSLSPFTEFLLVGGATLFLYPLSFALRATLGLDASELAIGFLAFHAAFVVNDPHFTVTYLLFYKRDVARAQPVRWTIAGVVVPLLLLVWGAGALAMRSAQTLGWMVQLMYLLVGWHYAKQGFGVLTVLSARAGVFLTARERTAFLANAYAGWAFAWANPAAPAGEFEERGVVYWAFAHPRWLEVVTGVAFVVSCAALVAALVARSRRGDKNVPRAPLTGFLVTIWAWTIFSSADPLVRFVVPALHSLQYFYFVWLMKRNEALAHEGPPHFGRPVRVRLALLLLSAIGLSVLLFHALPGFFDAAVAARWQVKGQEIPLGETPFVAAFYVFLNVHHYFMDFVVWRRENPDTRYLRTGDVAASAASSASAPAG
jgi:hypothetical protein